MGGHHRFKPEKAAKLLDPKREELLPIKEVLALLKIKEDEIIADLGCGNGYLTVPLLSKAKHVYAVDIEPKMLELLKERIDGEKINDITYVVSNLEQIDLNTNSVDKAVVAFVAHEIAHLDKAIGEFKRMIRQNGTILIIDWEAVEMEMGPPVHERIPSEQLKQSFEEYGFKVTLGHLNSGIYYLKAQIK
ncbi:class I SAM-dependent methyltransferase [Bacillus aquiflavi]|uniref:Class I SAM-dependent methyltransferase n=2 Tax=Bacillus aquiflavi TaxID=2672567 RepID=A0A6B3W0G3_9BACI|nr:class I SAM-dependent methyltransferase [Bacillus aquiflavi]MBA4537740.1 class I SAM-dependent methyltransferase [Bacillus aquiflavi]NEY81997.1 class I SAM-dependent methyltransferase [Bacillus aquiflavi]